VAASDVKFLAGLLSGELLTWFNKLMSGLAGALKSSASSLANMSMILSG